MGRGKSGKGSNKNPKRKALAHADDSDDDMMNDDIDSFHKQRDIIPLDVNDDSDDSDDETDLPVFDSKDEDENEDDEEEDDEDIEDDSQLTGLAAKIARQQKYLRAKVGGVEDEMHEDDEDAEEKETVWGRGKERYYGGENVDYEIQSSDEELHDEEEEVLRLQREKVMSLSAEDFGLEHVSEDESEKEQTMEEILVGGVKHKAKASKEKVACDDGNFSYEEVKKDLNALSKEEKMDVVYSSAPELVSLLSELNSAMDELDNKVNPLLSKVREGQNGENGSMNYIELKRLLLLTYCQYITFYLLLKAEGESARDHPVISRIVELKELLDKTKRLDSYLPDVEDILNKKEHMKETVKLPGLMSDGLAKDLLVTQEQPETIVMPKDALNVECTKDCGNKQKKRKHQDDQLPVQSLEMLKVRAALEEKLKHKGVMNTIKKKDDKIDRLPLLNRKFETLDDFDDDTIDPSLRPSKLSRLVTAQVSKPKMISGDDDLPKRDDIGERRRKHELRVLAHAGINTGNDMKEDMENGGGLDQEDNDDDEGSDMKSEDEFYKQVKQQREAKLAAKSEKYSRKPAVPIREEEEVEVGKRHISYQMEKNRGLTRHRKKLIKNPRKKYKLKHQKAVDRRKGQVRDIIKQTGSYGGETTGINPRISRSVRF